jgi:hypothetical protein
MLVESCIPIIPSANLEKSLRLWVDGLGFSMSSEMRKDDKLIFCMLRVLGSRLNSDGLVHLVIPGDADFGRHSLGTEQINHLGLVQ